ncbi:MAG TPA: HEPN domain-containing protein [Ktedonobacteraceae bacterium]|nr:HEPN domain-containing protein [Ktedonobacteraceae bacterium]
MSQTHAAPGDNNEDDLEQLLLQEVHLADKGEAQLPPAQKQPHCEDEEDENAEVFTGSDVQGAFGLYAEAAQDMATAGVELGLGRHFACVDYCNQAVEKAAQAVSLLRFGRRMPYNHDLGALAAAVGAPEAIQQDMDALTPFHPEAFYADTPPEEADEVISAEQASDYLQKARQVLRWARQIVLNP